MEVLRKQNERSNKDVLNLTSINHKLSEPLKKAEIEVTEYKKQLENYRMDKISLTVSI